MNAGLLIVFFLAQAQACRQRRCKQLLDAEDKQNCQQLLPKLNQLAEAADVAASIENNCNKDSCLSLKDGTTVKLSQTPGEQKMATIAVIRRDIGQTQDSRARASVGTRLNQWSGEAPIGCRNVQHKVYSAAEIMLSRMNFCDGVDDQQKATDEVGVYRDAAVERATNDATHGDLQLASVRRTTTKAAKIVAPTNLKEPQRPRTTLRRSSHLRPADSVTRLRRRRSEHAHVASIVFDAKVENLPRKLEKTENEEAVGRGAPSPASDDRGYHSDTGASSSQTTIGKNERDLQGAEGHSKSSVTDSFNSLESFEAYGSERSQTKETRRHSVYDEKHLAAQATHSLEVKSKPGRL